MALENITLRKLLKLMFLEGSERQSALRSDIREDLRREHGETGGGGGDFYSPFWADAKSHVFGGADLRSSTDKRIAANARRENLYPLLRDGFLDWWDEKRRWTNLPFNPGKKLRSRHHFSDLNATVRVENVLTVIDGNSDEHVVYSYFSPNPALTIDGARLGLWLLSEALPHIRNPELRILDIIRGNSYSIDRVELTGEEEIEFKARYARLIRERDALRLEYD